MQAKLFVHRYHNNLKLSRNQWYVTEIFLFRIHQLPVCLRTCSVLVAESFSFWVNRKLGDYPLFRIAGSLTGRK